MSESGTSNEWDKLWQEYTKSLENWRSLFESVQKATSDMQQKFNQVMEKAGKESSADTMKQFGENWQKAMSQAGLDTFKTFGESWQKAMNEPSFNAFQQVSDNWQKTFNETAMEQMKSYGEMMKKFTETWNTMWPQK